MKKRLISLVLVVLLLFAFNGTALAATSGDYALLSTSNFTSGLTLVSGSIYQPWARATASVPEDISVSFTLSKLINGTFCYVTSASNSVTGTYVKAAKNVTLTPGIYRLNASYSNESDSGSSTRSFTI